ncbi:MAG: hypothetical protein NXI09_14290 [Bacteroidetes bacterium]|nr:hypothetical protein [Bacteroidota bacterium]
MRVSLFFLLVLFSFQNPLRAQSIKRFTPEKTTYLRELKDFLDEENDIEEEVALALASDFDSLFITDYSDEEAEWIFRISNNLLRKRVKRFEDWEHFLRITIYYKNDLPEGEMINFLKDFESLSKRPAKKISSYLATVYNVMYFNVLYDDGRLKWKVNGEIPNYSFKEGPVFSFPANSDLVGFYKNDSTIIEGTAGEFRPGEYLFKGTGGTGYFLRAGMPKDSAYVLINNYSFDVTKPDLSIDSVVLHTNFYLDQPVEGNWQEKLTSQSGGSGHATFPRFRSYRTDLYVPYILPHAQFLGGFSIIGDRFYGGGNDSSRATIIFAYKDTVLIKATSRRFWLRKDKVYSEDVEAVIYLGPNDSIYHPKITMRYLPELKQFSLIRKDEGMGSAVFADSYHNLDMLFDIITWEVGSPQMKISSLNMGSTSPVVFESNNYYRGQRFDDLRGMSNAHPLFELRKLSKKLGDTRTFTDKDVAYHLKMDRSDAHRYLMRFAVLGFIDYSVQTREAYLKDKVFEYILNYQGVRDFDVIQFVSRLENGTNATLSLENYAMEVEGIRAITLSDSQKVGLFPADEKIVIHKDLNFDFNGKISAGRFNFWGNQFKFNYEQFRIGMEDIDSMRFKVLSFEPNALGQRYLVDVKTVLQDLTGDLQIDKPNNKSGKASYSEYPIFNSAKDAYIYYDKPSIFDGVYNRENFYVRLEPFEIDSLDNTSTTGLSFAGTFTSAGIFPEFDEPIKVQRDYSLGFTRQTPPGGFPAYGGKGQYTAQLSLSNQGLRGDGQLEYLNSTAQSQEFFFFPDSTDGKTSSYEIVEKTGRAGSNPHVMVDTTQLHWEPYNDVLYTSTIKEPFKVYDQLGMRTSGTLAHSPTGLKGKGLNEFLDAETRSKDYTYESRRLLSPNTAFRVRANPRADWGFGVDSARAEIDFDDERGRFNLLNTNQYFSLSANKYIAYMDFALWQIPEKAIDMRKESGVGLSEMISVHPHQDSLRFLAEHSKFYLENTLLESFQVPEIMVADAYIYPDTGYVAIDSNAVMRTLVNSSITADLVDQYHKFYGAEIDISSANYYQGFGDYEYLDKDGTPWPIRFETIRVDTGTTVGRAAIKEEDYFFMSPHFGYYGNVRLRAAEKELYFQGYTHIEADCDAISTNWFAFKSKIDPANILIELPEVDSEDKTKLLANGVYLNSDTISGYAAFLSQEVRPTDKQMFFANGVLFYDEGITSYVITEREKIEDPSLPINILRFNNLNCTMLGEGSMSLGDGKSQLRTNSYGLIKYDLNTDEMQLDLAMGMEFFFAKELIEKLALIVADNSEGNGVDIGREAFKIASSHRLEPKDLKKFNDEVAAFGAPEKVPDDLQQTLLFGELTMNWTPESISFLSEGPIGIAGLGEEFVNSKVTGFVEIQRKRRGDEVYIYLDLGGDEIYIDYKRNKMGVYTTNEEFMTLLKEMDIKDRRNEERSMPPFTYTISTKGKMNRFIRRFDSFE